jgi:hypothetical protein
MTQARATTAVRNSPSSASSSMRGLLVGREHRRLDADAAQRPALGTAPAQRLVQDVAPDPEHPGSQGAS